MSQLIVNARKIQRSYSRLCHASVCNKKAIYSPWFHHDAAEVDCSSEFLFKDGFQEIHLTHRHTSCRHYNIAFRQSVLDGRLEILRTVYYKVTHEVYDYMVSTLDEVLYYTLILI